MTRGPVSGKDLELLREVLASRAPGRLDELLYKVREDSLVTVERAQLCELIGAELAATGLDSNSEPTPRGERLELLLDYINRPNVER